MNHTDSWYKEQYGYFENEGHGSVKSVERSKKFGEVFTPNWLVYKMLDEIPGSSGIDNTVFEPACGEGAFIKAVLRRKLQNAHTDAEKIRCCQTCYGVDIQYDNVLACRRKLVDIAVDFGVDVWRARFIFARNIVHGDFLFFPMLIRIYDWKDGTWTTIEDMEKSNDCIQ